MNVLFDFVLFICPFSCAKCEIPFIVQIDDECGKSEFLMDFYNHANKHCCCCCVSDDRDDDNGKSERTSCDFSHRNAHKVGEIFCVNIESIAEAPSQHVISTFDRLLFICQSVEYNCIL